MTCAELLVRAADAVSHTGSPARAVGMVEAALGLVGDDAEPEARASLLERLGHHRWVACDEAGSGRARQAAVELVADRPPTVSQAVALAAWGRHQMLVDRYVDAEKTLRAALAVAEMVGSEQARSSALSGLGIDLVKQGRVDEGVKASRESLDIAQREGEADDIGLAFVNLTAALLAATHCEEAAQTAVAGLEHARRTGTLATDGVVLAYGGAEALCWLGAWDEATGLLAAHTAVSDGPHGTTGAVISARIAFWRGQTELAAHHRDRALTPAKAHSDPAPEALVCAAQIANREGRFDDARRHCADAFEIIEKSEDLLLVATALAVAMEVEADRVEAARWRGPYGEADATAARAVADELRARARNLVGRLGERGLSPQPDAAALLAVADAEHDRAWERHDPDRWATIASQWEALRFPYPAAFARLHEADSVLRVRRSRERASAAARAALATAERLGAAPLAHQARQLAQRGRLDLGDPPETAPPAADPLRDLGISPREGEVLVLLAQGRTNHQIAEELYISEKTASVHVTHLLRKLRVTSRIEAAAIAQRLSLGASPAPRPVTGGGAAAKR